MDFRLQWFLMDQDEKILFIDKEKSKKWLHESVHTATFSTFISKPEAKSGSDRNSGSTRKLREAGFHL